MRFDPVTYEDVREACCALLGKGEGPSRPKVQELLAENENIRRKGSNSLVQGFINRFWSEAADRMNKPTREVADVPEEFVPVIDRALVEMVAISRKMAAEEFSDKEEKLQGQIGEWQGRIQKANDTAAAAEQLRVRAEGELRGTESIVADLRASIKTLEEKLADGVKKIEAQQQTIVEKDAELARQFAALETAIQKLDMTNAAHRQEVIRLMKQVDDERQAGRRDCQALRQQIDGARSENEKVRGELSRQREDNARIQAELAAKNATVEAQATVIKGLNTKHAEVESAAQKLQREAMLLSVKFETAEALRKESEGRYARQAEEVGELRQVIAGLTVGKS